MSEQDGFRCTSCNAKWTAPVPQCPECGEEGLYEDESLRRALAFLNEYFKPWTYDGWEPAAQALAGVLRSDSELTALREQIERVKGYDLQHKDECDQWTVIKGRPEPCDCGRAEAQRVLDSLLTRSVSVHQEETAPEKS